MSVAIAVRRTEKNYLGGVAQAIRTRAQGGGRAVMTRNLLAMGEPLPASTARRMREWQAQHHARYRIGDGQGLFLSGDGKGTTTCSRSAWFGSEEQARKALSCFGAAKGMRALFVIDGKVPHRSVIRQLWGEG